jgi:predicted amidophosphoribosyltransferase
MNAETLNCPMCGAATSTDEPLCNYCGSRLATIACASCFGMMFIGSIALGVAPPLRPE